MDTEIIIIVIGVIMGLILVIGVPIGLRIKKKVIAETKADYDEALKGTDKQKALIAGRAYYSALRHGAPNGTITIYDEAAINNDIAVMKE